MTALRLLFTFALFLVVVQSRANVFTVNSESGFAADYTNIQAAVNAASSGDTIYVQPSSVSYSSFNLSKMLYIIGGGHNPEYSPYTSLCIQVVFQSGSGGSVLKGLNINTVASTSSTVANDVVISGCYIYTISMDGASTFNNWILEGNVFESLNSSGFGFNTLDANLIVRNNFFLKNGSSGFFMAGINAGALIEHNIFRFTSSLSFSGLVNGTGINVTIRDNIYYFSTSTSMSSIQNGCSSCTFANNLTYNSAALEVPTLPGTNYNNYEPDFVNFPATASAYDYGLNFNVGDESSANNGATDGTDVGIYGGIFNYSMAGFDGGTPRVGDIILQTSSAPQGGTMTIQLKAHGSGQ